jgi:peptidyl-prolyl cis-trans isomerase SurA
MFGLVIFQSWRSRLLSALCFSLLGLALASPPVRAQVIVESVNGDPITTVDLEMRMRMLRVQHKPATREAAIDDLIADRLKQRETNKYSIDANDQDQANYLNTEAKTLNLNSQAYLANLARAGVSTDHVKAHLHSAAAWYNYIHALNRNVGVSERDIKAEMAKQDKRKQTADYIMHQIVLVVPLNASGEVFQRRMREAEALRTRFTDCATGLQLARSLPDAAVKEQLSRNAASFSEQVRDLLDRTPVGHLTPPTRGSGGVEMLAICQKFENADDSTLHDRISALLLDQHLKKESDRLYAEVRAHAVITKH